MFPLGIHPLLQSYVDVLHGLQKRSRARRLEMNMTQAELAERSGVSLGTVRRYERTGEISLRSFLALAWILGELKEFHSIYKERPPISLRTDPPKPRQRGRRRKKDDILW